MTRNHRGIRLAVAVALALVLGRLVFAAISTQNLAVVGVDATALANSLAGPGIQIVTDPALAPAPTISTPLVSGVPTKLSAGKFANGLSIGGATGLGFDAGVILSTGNINSANDTNANNNSARVSTAFAGAGDPDLTLLLPPGQSTFDATVLDFYFVPNKDKVFLQYVFASDEYNEFVYDPRGFSDVFAFFVNGVNCATVGGQIVSINTINNGSSIPGNTTPPSHPEFFRNNDFRASPGSPFQIQMDGLTKVLTCKASVVPNATNHIRMAIADAGDSSVDSVVFLKGGSFTTTPPISITKETNETQYDDYGPNGPFVLAASPVKWKYRVQNNGTDALTNVVVSDVDDHGNSIAVDCAGISSLAAGQTIDCSATGSAIKNQYNNVSAVTAVSALIGDVTDSSPGHYFGADPKVKVVTTARGTNSAGGFVDCLSADCTLFVGDAVSWTYTVTNTGNVPLKSVTVTDNTGIAVNCSTVPGFPPKTDLAAGESMVCSAAGIVQAGDHTNTGHVSGSVDTVNEEGLVVTVTRDDPNPNSAHYFGADPRMAIVKTTDGTDNNTAPGLRILFGDEVAWKFTVTNTGNVALSGVKVTDDRLGDVCTVGALALGPAASCDQIVTAEKGQHTESGHASGTFTGTFKTKTVTGADPDSYFGADPHLAIVTTTNGSNNATAPGPLVLVGDRVKWVYSVTNTGNVALTGIAVTDTPAGPVCAIDLLDTSLKTTAACELVSTAQPGQYDNLGTVSSSIETVTKDGGLKIVPVNASDPDHYFGADPHIAIVTTTNGTNSNTAPGPFVLVGDPVKWVYSVTNTGNVSLFNVSIVDTPGGSVCVVDVLDTSLKKSALCERRATAQRDQYDNTGTATTSIETVTEDGSHRTVPVAVSDPDHYFGAAPELAIITTTNGTNSSTAPGPFVLVGDRVRWVYSVTNTGNVPLANVAVTDTPGGPVCVVDLLDTSLRKSAACERGANAQRDQYDNTGFAAASFQTVTEDGTPRTVPVEASDPDHYFGAAPGLAIVTTTNGGDYNNRPGPLVLVGDPVKWVYSVTNTGNVPLTHVAVTDTPGGPACVVDLDTSLGKTAQCERRATALRDQYDNVGAAHAGIQTVTEDGTPKTVEVDASDPDHYFGAAPELAVVTTTNTTNNNTRPGPFVLVGDPVKWVYSVTNTGNVPLATVAVTDTPGGSVCVIDLLDTSLKKTATCERGATAQRDQYDNSGTATTSIETVTEDGGHKTVTVQGSDADHYFGADPSIKVVSTTNGVNGDLAPGPYILVGDQVKWSYLVTNTGNVPLSNVTVNDDTAGAVCTIGHLDAGAASSCDAKETATKGQHGNGGGATGTIETVAVTGDVKTVTRSSNAAGHYFGAAPSITALTKTNGSDNNTAPGPYVLVGDPVKWLYSVTNTGNVPLSNVVVTDDQAGVICTIGTLATGASQTCDKLSSAVKDQHTNLGGGTGTINTVDVEGDVKIVTVTGSDVDHYFGADPKFTIVKTTNGTNNDTAPGALILVGDPVRWTYTVTNTGNVPLTDVAVTDDKAGPICTIGTLVVGRTVSCELLKPGADVPKGAHDDDHGKGDKDHAGDDDRKSKDDSRSDHDDDKSRGGGDSADHDSDGKPKGGYSSDRDNDQKSRHDDSADRDDHGKSGNGDQKGQRDDDRRADATDHKGDEEGKSRGGSKADHDDRDDHDDDGKRLGGAQKGQYRNVGTVRGQIRTVTVDGQPKIVTRTDSDVDYYFGVDPRISLIKRTNGTKSDKEPGRGILAGRAVTWTYEVKNTGNIALMVTLTDDKLGAVPCPSHVLEAGASMVCSATGKAVKGYYENVGTVMGSVGTLNINGTIKTVTRTDQDTDCYFGVDDSVFFVIGDKQRHHVGDGVNFWGAQWWKSNEMSATVSPGSSSFKGFANEVKLTGDDCGVWTSRPGNSSAPPDRIPDYVPIIVTSDVVKNGSAFGGKIKEIVIVRQDGKYGSNPGRGGSGQVFTVACDGR